MRVWTLGKRMLAARASMRLSQLSARVYSVARMGGWEMLFRDLPARRQAMASGLANLPRGAHANACGGVGGAGGKDMPLVTPFRSPSQAALYFVGCRFCVAVAWGFCDVSECVWV